MPATKQPSALDPDQQAVRVNIDTTFEEQYSNQHLARTIYLLVERMLRASGSFPKGIKRDIKGAVREELRKTETVNSTAFNRSILIFKD